MRRLALAALQTPGMLEINTHQPYRSKVPELPIACSAGFDTTQNCQILGFETSRSCIFAEKASGSGLLTEANSRLRFGRMANGVISELLYRQGADG